MNSLRRMLRPSGGLGTALRRSFHRSAERPSGSLYQLSEDERMLRETVGRLAREEIGPLVRKMERQGRFEDALISKLFSNGLMGLEIEPEYGGSGLNFFSSILAVEEIAKVDSSVAVLVDIQNTLVNSLVRKLGSQEQKARFLPRLAQSCAGSFCLSEAAAGSDAFAMKV